MIRIAHGGCANGSRRLRRDRYLVAMRVAGLLLAGCASRNEELNPLSSDDITPMDEYRLSTSAVSDVLAPYETISQMVEFVDTLPDRCVPATASSVVCVWSLDSVDAGWQLLNPILGTKWMINIVCEFPSDETARSLGSCSAHHRASNRDYWQGRSDKRVRHDARVLLDGATTAFELSTVVGDAPRTCVVDATRSRCTWATSNNTYGHGTMAVLARAAFGNKVLLICSLPADGSPRLQTDCSAVVGD